jgi:hypothetical protein
MCIHIYIGSSGNTQAFQCASSVVETSVSYETNNVNHSLLYANVVNQSVELGINVYIYVYIYICIYIYIYMLILSIKA